MCPDIRCQGSIFIRENRPRRKERTGARLRLPAELGLLGAAHRPIKVQKAVQRLAARWGSEGIRRGRVSDGIGHADVR